MARKYKPEKTKWKRHEYKVLGYTTETNGAVGDIDTYDNGNEIYYEYHRRICKTFDTLKEAKEFHEALRKFLREMRKKNA